MAQQEIDLPAVDDEEFLIVRDATQDDWLVLEGHYEWTQPTSAGREHFELPQRQFLYTVTSCLVRTRDASAVAKSMLNLRLHGRTFWSRGTWSDRSSGPGNA